MKTFQQFREDLSKNIIKLDKKAQENLNKSKKGQFGPGSKPVPHTSFKLVPSNIPMN